MIVHHKEAKGAKKEYPVTPIPSFLHVFDPRTLRLGDFDRVGGAHNALEIAIDGELTRSEGGNHDDTGAEAAEETPDTELAGDLDKARGDGLALDTLLLVDLGEQGIGGLGNNGSGRASDNAGAEIHSRDGSVGELILGLANGTIDVLTGLGWGKAKRERRWRDQIRVFVWVVDVHYT